jgi:hypothetical protein
VTPFNICPVTSSHRCAVTYWLTATGSTVRSGETCGPQCEAERDAWFESCREFLEGWLREAPGDRTGRLRGLLHDFGVAFPAWPALPESVEPWWRTPCAPCREGER